MAHRPNGIPGPFFHLLVVSANEYVKRRGWSGRLKEIKKKYFRHPDALKVSDSIVSLVSDRFRAANPRFYFWGYTEFEGEALTRLETGLRERRETI